MLVSLVCGTDLLPRRGGWRPVARRARCLRESVSESLVGVLEGRRRRRDFSALAEKSAIKAIVLRVSTSSPCVWCRKARARRRLA